MKPSSLTPVPIPDHVAVVIGGCMPRPVLQAEIEADSTAREALRFRAPSGSALLDDDDRADRERELSRLARSNKVLAAYDPRLIVTPQAVAV